MEISGSRGRSVMVYGPEQQLVRSTEYSGSTTRVTTYVNPVFEVVTSGGSTEFRHNLKAGEETVAVIRWSGSGCKLHNLSTHYLHRDHLQSIVAITDDQGKVVDRRHYDAFGKERHGVATPGTTETLLPLLTNHGFTGHKQLPSVDLVHMEGRVHDPALGRFLSADPFVQAPLSAQSYNRYSYVLNNPLSYTDPSGYFFKSIFKAVKKVVNAVVDVVSDVVREVTRFVKEYAMQLAAVAVACVAPYAVAAVAPALLATAGSTAFVAGLSATGTLVAGAVGGGLAGFIATGSLKGALIGVASGMAFAQIGNMFATGGRLADVGSKFASAGSRAATAVTNGFKALAHGIVGGVRSVLSGARFEQGFLAAGFTEAFSPAISYAGVHGGLVAECGTAALIGGAGSQLAGGKFADGAVTGVLSSIFRGGIRQGENGGDLFNGALDMLGKIWALPNSIAGLAYGGVGMLFGATPVWDSQAGILRFTNIPGWMMPSAMSFGHVQVYGPGSYTRSNGSNPALNRMGIPVVAEENLHTQQAEVLGPFYLPSHSISMLGSIFTGGGTHNNNLLELGPERGRGPWPWN